MNLIISNSICNGNVTPPSSINLSHRSLICSALAMYQADNRTKDIKLEKVKNLVLANDTFETLEALNNKLCKFYSESDDIRYKDRFNLNVLKNLMDQDLKEVKINIDNSFITLKLIISIYLALGINVEVNINKDINDNIIDFYSYLFNNMEIEYSVSKINNTCKLIGKGKLKSGDIVIEDIYDDNLCISGLLMALPLLSGNSRLVIKKIDSFDSILLTLDVMRAFGVELSYSISDSKEYIFDIKGLQTYKLRDLDELNIENDYVAAMNFIVLGLINNGIIVNGMTQNSLQGEYKLVKEFEKLGLVSISGSDIIVNKDKELSYKEFDLTNYPDLAPIVVVYLTQTGGIIHNVNKLLFKDSNLLMTITQELGKAGIIYRYEKNKLFIDKIEKLKTNVVFDSHNEPLIAMALTIFSSINDGKAIISDCECIARIYPNFLIDFYNCNGKYSTF